MEKSTTAKVRQRAFLGVEQSARGLRWVPRLSAAGENRALAMAQGQGAPELISRVLVGRDVAVNEAEAFLNPTLRGLMPDPLVMTDCGAAVERIVQAIRKGEKVSVFGDYDVDGACSSALMYRFLQAFDIDVDIYIPDRIFEGYGPNPQAINALIDAGAGLIVTVDCGSTSHESLSAAKARNIDVVVIDHHQVGADLPHCRALVNPNRDDDLSGQGHLCAAGVVYLVLVATLRALRQAGDTRAAKVDLLSWLDIVALATVCDVVPLKGLNRAYVVKGLIVARSLSNPGLAALFKRAGLSGPISPYHFGFIIGPRINAGGRIGDAALGSRLLTVGAGDEVDAIADQLDQLNRERQVIEAEMLVEAESDAVAEFGDGAGAGVIVTARQGWHPGIVGLLASRLKDRFGRPSFAIAFDANGRGSGSGRSIAGFDVGRMVRMAVDNGLLIKGGGHAMAAGLTVTRDRLSSLRAFFEEYALETVEALSTNATLKVDGAISASAANLELIDLLESAGPYGSGHPQPVFAVPDHKVRDARIIGSGGHIKVTLESAEGTQLDGIAFRAAEKPLGDALLSSRGRGLHVVGSLSGDYWQGRRRVQLRIIDSAVPK